MYLEKLTVRNFRSFGPDTVTMEFDPQLTAFIGANAVGKTAACQALLRLFSVASDERQVRADDFHVPHDEMTAPTNRTLTIETVFAFPELSGEDRPSRNDAPAEPDDNDQDLARGTFGEEDVPTAHSVPEFFAQMTADDGGSLKLRIVLEASWVQEGRAEGTVEVSRRVVYTFANDYGDNWAELRATDRNRIQMVYVPANRDGTRQVKAFLRGRIWSAANWSDSFSAAVHSGASALTTEFQKEQVVDAVTEAISTRWQSLHRLGLDKSPYFEPIRSDISTLVTEAELYFTPSATGRTRRVSELSDGQQSLLYMALVTATLDLEAEIASGGHDDKFDITGSSLPVLTLLALEEPENNLAPFYLSRVIQQLLDVTKSGRAQAVVSSHSTSVMSRIDPEQVRHMRLDLPTRTTVVREISMPAKSSDAGKYLREAVRAHPELYFAKFVVLGEGDSEELVIPKLAAARDLHIDPSFVAMIPLGGRHTNHFWRLLSQLEIPHATLLDLDYGRAGGGEGRIRYVCDRLEEINEDPFEGISGFDSVGDITDLDPAQLTAWMDHLERWNVYFSAPLDLDMLLLSEFMEAYTTDLEQGATGPRRIGDPRTSVLGEKGDRPNVEYWNDSARDETLYWYRYLFLGQSKPSTHLRALSKIPCAQLQSPPKRLDQLLNRISLALGEEQP